MLDNVLGRDDSSPLKKALVGAGITDMFALNTLDNDTIDDLVYDVSPTEKDVSINRGDKSLLWIFLDYVIHRVNKGDPIGDDWTAVTAEDFDQFRINPQYGGQLRNPGPNQTSTSSTAAPTPSPSTNTSKYSPVEVFRRGIKRDPSLFPTLKDEKYHDSWHRSFANQARAQGVSDVIDPNYSPSGDDEKALFDEKQKFMYAVLDAKVMTDNGKAIVRDHENDFDAQQVYKKLSELHLKSTKARMDSSTILSYITSARLGSGEWRGTCEGFIIHWENQVRLYERQVPASDHFSDGQKRTMLENAVMPIDELHQVKTTADLDTTKSGQTLTYDEYVNLLKSAAQVYDKRFEPKRSKRQVYLQELFEALLEEDNDEEPYGIDMPAAVIQANASERRPIRPSGPSLDNRVRMPFERWKQLTEDAKKIWDQLTDQDKSVILASTKKSDSTDPTRDRQARLHEQGIVPDDADTEEFTDAKEELDDDGSSALIELLVNAAKTSKPLPPTDLRRILSSSSKRDDSKSPSGSKKSEGGSKKKLEAKMHITYHVSNRRTLKTNSLIDRGANGGVAGDDVRVICSSHRKVDIQGIDNHQVTDVKIGSVGGVVNTQKGPVIAIFHQYALFGKGHTIHSPGQMEWYKLDVNDKSCNTPGGLQRITTLDGYVIPLIMSNGLARMPLRPYTDKEWDSLPHVFMTSDFDWDPTVLDHDPTENEQWFDAVSDVESKDPAVDLFDEYGEYRHRITVQATSLLSRGTIVDLEDAIDRCVFATQVLAMADGYHSYGCDSCHFYEVNEHEIDPAVKDTGEPPPDITAVPRTLQDKPPDYNILRPLFGWLSVDTIKNTLERTTQYGRIPGGTTLKRFFKSFNPALNVPRRNERIAADFVYSDTPAVDDGATSAVLFVGLDSSVTDAYGVKTDKQFVNTLEDNIRERGAPTQLISDRAQTEIGKKVKDILRALFISSWQSEPHQQQQNPAERRIQTVKTMLNRIMDRTGAPAFTWLLCLLYVCFLLNHTYDATIRNVPLTALTGDTVDVSPLLRFHFWQKVYYKHADHDFPSESKEGVGRIVGISEHVGPALTWKVLTNDTHKVIYRSLLRPCTETDPNLRAESLGGEEEPPPQNFLHTRFDNLQGDGETNRPSTQTDSSDADNPDDPPSPIVDPEELVGRTFLMDKREDGQKFRARIVELVKDHENDVDKHPDRIKFVCSVNNDEFEEVLSYNQLLGFINKNSQDDFVWKFRRIISHQGPLSPSHPDYKGSSYNVMIEWENGEITSEPLSVIAADDPVTCAVYAKDNGLLEEPGWKRFRSIAKRHKKFVRMVNQAKLRSYNTAPRYQYGFEVPRDYNHALRLDERNGNTRWRDAVKLEMDQIWEYETFEDKGHKDKVPLPEGYKKIRVHLVFAVKHDGRHKARLVADGHLTDVPIDSVYSGVVSLRGFRLILFLAELNDLEIWATDIGNAYLEAFTSERVYIIAGSEFGDLQGHILIVKKALYGLRSSGARWHDRFADVLRELGFAPCKAEPDIWMRKNGDVYEYVAVYVDDLALAMKDPKPFTETLINKYKFKLKGTGPIKFHLGMDFYRDDDGTLCIAPIKYIEKMIGSYRQMFGEAPKQNVTSPLEKGDHPETDTSDLLNEDDTRKYQSLIGSYQWAVTIGRIDITTAVMTLASFRAMPRVGHLERAKRLCGYLAKMKHAAIRVRTDEPDYSDIPEFEYDWSKSVYGDVMELIPTDAPEPLGKYVTLSHFFDANLMHDIVTGRSVTGILHLVNKTPVDWFSKKQPTVETATYGSEFVAGRTCVEQVIDLRCTLRYLGVPIRKKSYMFGDNESMVNSSTQVHAKLHKRHTILSFHRVREAVASGMIALHYMSGDINPADILSKHWGYSQVWTRLKTLLFWRGDTAEIED